MQSSVCGPRWLRRKVREFNCFCAACRLQSKRSKRRVLRFLFTGSRSTPRHARRNLQGLVQTAEAERVRAGRQAGKSSAQVREAAIGTCKRVHPRIREPFDFCQATIRFSAAVVHQRPWKETGERRASESLSGLPAAARCSPTRPASAASEG